MKIIIGLVAIIAAAVGAIFWFGLSEPDVAELAKSQPSAGASQPGPASPQPRLEGRRPRLADPEAPEVPEVTPPMGAAGEGRRDGFRRRRDRTAFDTNHDGRLDPSERDAMRASRRERWEAREIEAFDDNGDGKLDDQEAANRDRAIEQRRQERNAQIMSRVDANADGKITAAEVAGDERLQRMLGDSFEAADANRDGSLDSQELNDALAAGQEAWRKRRMDALGGNRIRQ